MGRVGRVTDEEDDVGAVLGLALSAANLKPPAVPDVMNCSEMASKR